MFKKMTGGTGMAPPKGEPISGKMASPCPKGTGRKPGECGHGHMKKAMGGAKGKMPSGY